MDLENFFYLIQVHVDIENFFHPQVEKYLQVHVDLENFFVPTRKIFNKSTWT